MFGRSVSLNAIDIYTTQPKNGNTIGHFHLLHPPKTDKTVVLLSTMHNKEDVNTDSEKKKPLMIWTTAPPRVQWIPLTWKSTGQVLHVRKVNQTMTNKTFLLPRGCCLTECFRCLVYGPSSVETQSHAKSRTNDVHSCLPLPTTWWSQWLTTEWLTTGHSQPTSHICRPDRLQGHAGDRCRTSRMIAPTSAATGSKKRGRCRADHNLRNRTYRRLSIAAQSVSSVYSKHQRKLVYNYCGLSAAVAVWHSRWWVNKKHLIAYASSFCKQCSSSDY